MSTYVVESMTEIPSGRVQHREPEGGAIIPRWESVMHQHE